MGMLITCIMLGFAAVAFAAALAAASRENRALRARLGVVGDAEQEAARIRRISRAELADAELEAARLATLARGMVLEAEDEAARIVADAQRRLDRLRDEIAHAELEREEPTGVFRMPAPHHLLA